ncbi:substrate-binding periplasmic protein [Bdellovibrio sp. HCB2-146]|uniref:substrate-binding periplasmic protein n=1 Tax=Bdellovibrio sp. HCB2-146 TaxID=3394362 RepID=UPI0039BD201B
MNKAILWIGLSLFLVSNAVAGGKACKRRFEVGVASYPPFFSRNASNQPEGFTYELIEGMQNRLGICFIIKELSRPALMENLATHRIDAVMLVAQNAAFEKSANFIQLWNVSREIVVAKSIYSKDKKIQSYIDDKKVIFGNIIGTRTSLTSDEEKDLFKNQRLLEAVDIKSTFDLLSKGRVQAVLLSPLLNNYYLNMLPNKNDFVRVGDPDDKHRVDAGIYTSKIRVKDEDRESILKAIEEIRKDGTLAKIIKKYYGEDATEANLQL